MKVKSFMLLLFAASAAHAAPESGNDAPPSAELLEFLGEWQTAKGQLIDPLDLQQDERQDAPSKPVEDKKHD